MAKEKKTRESAFGMSWKRKKKVRTAIYLSTPKHMYEIRFRKTCDVLATNYKI